jgi:hypothetical protein
MNRIVRAPSIAASHASRAKKTARVFGLAVGCRLLSLLRERIDSSRHRPGKSVKEEKAEMARQVHCSASRSFSPSLYRISTQGANSP